MRIAEIYRSRQGEGLLTGKPSVFISTSGCNLRCSYCDTPYTSWDPEGEDLSVEEILEQVVALEPAHAVLTGGEPMLHAELVPLAAALAERDCHITIETAGTLYLPVTCNLMSISPKLSNSTPSAESSPRWHRRHEHSRHTPGVVRKLIEEYAYQFKFVVATLADCEEVERYLDGIAEIDRGRVWLMPEGTDHGRLAGQGQWLAQYCRSHGLRFCPRKQIEWYGHARRT